MSRQKAVGRLLQVGSVSLLTAVLLLTVSPRLDAGERSPATDSSDTPRESPRAEPPPSDPPQQAEPSPPSDPPSDNNSAPEPPRDDSSDRTAVPTGPDGSDHGPSRQPPTQHSGGGHGHSGGGSGVPEDGAVWTDEDSVVASPTPWFHGGFGRGARNGHGGHAGMGALDLDLRPSQTEVYLDGQRLGTVDDFDGWPRYLWLEPGTYDLAFYLNGYQTLTRQITVRPGLVIDMDDRLQPGPSTLPPGITD